MKEKCLVEIRKVKPRRCTETGIHFYKRDMFAVDIPSTRTDWKARVKLQVFFTHVRKYKCLQKPVCGLLSVHLTLDPISTEIIQNHGQRTL